MKKIEISVIAFLLFARTTTHSPARLLPISRPNSFAQFNVPQISLRSCERSPRLLAFVRLDCGSGGELGFVRRIHARMTLFGGVSEPSLRGRRARRLFRTWRRRCPLMFFSLSLLSIVYLSFFGAKLPFDSNQSNTSLENEGFTNVTRVSNGREDDIYKRPSPKAHKHHGPCEVGLMESVDNIIEPETYMNFTRFSLQYIAKEDTSHGKDVFEARFGGHQTLEQREESFYAKNQIIHCGFIEGPERHPSTGFKLSEKDKEHMADCRVVVSSCIFGNSDFLRRPTSRKISTFSKKNVCFMMFLDELTLKKLSSEGHIPNEMGNIGLWRIIVVKHLPYADLRKTGKVPKFLSHRLFPSARYSIWLDSKMRLHTDPMLILEYFLWRPRSEYAISNHYDRHCVWEEVLQNKRLNKYNHTVINEQFMFYQSDGLVKFVESDHSSILPSFVPEGSFIVRAHTPLSNLFSCLWFNEVDRFTSRDQLSFAYTFLKLKRMNPGKPFHLNMFKDCERRAVCKLFHHRVEDINPPPPTTASTAN